MIKLNRHHPSSRYRKAEDDRRSAINKTLLALVVAVSLAGVSLLAQSSAEGMQDVQPMAADAKPSFEVATIRPSKAGESDKLPTEMGHRVVMTNTTVLFLLALVYDVHENQIVGAPTWAASEKFDFSGVSDTPGKPNLQQLKIMIQKLLTDRFQLSFHHEAKDIPAYVVTVAKSGPKMEKSKDDLMGLPSLMMQPGFPKVAAMKGTNLSMTEFAQLMQSGILDRPVVDQTGLAGKYNFLLRWTPDDSQFRQAGMRMPPQGDSADAPSLSTAMQEELGLKLTAEKKAKVEMTVVDRLERPSEN